MSTKTKEPKLLSGGNPQIPKGEGDAPVQAYIAAMPDELDEAQLTDWVKHAAALPGWMP